MDPQHRLLLEETLSGWTDAAAATGLARSGGSPTGVYVGSMYSEYTSVVVAGGQKLPPQAVVGSGLSFMVGRISYTFGFTGEAGCSVGCGCKDPWDVPLRDMSSEHV